MNCNCHDLYCSHIKKDSPVVKKLSDSEIFELYEFIKHGGEDHKAWLKEALFAFFNDKEKPEYKA